MEIKNINRLKDLANEGMMENLPKEIQRKILQSIGGEEIHFLRDENGRLVNIVGLKNDSQYSKVVFFYDNEFTSVHCATNIDQKEQSAPIRFKDFNIFSPRDYIWFYSVDTTTIDTTSQTIDKSIERYRFHYNGRNRIVKIEKNDNVVYTAEYDDSGRLIVEKQIGEAMVHEYAKNRLVALKKYLNSELVEHWAYSYKPNTIGPVGQYVVNDDNPELCQMNVFLQNGAAELPKRKKCNGIQVNYYTITGDHLASCYLPQIVGKNQSDFPIERLPSEHYFFSNMYLSFTNPETKNVHVIQKENSVLAVDQEIEFVDGRISRVHNNPESSFDGVLTSVLIKHWWQLR